MVLSCFNFSQNICIIFNRFYTRRKLFPACICAQFCLLWIWCTPLNLACSEHSHVAFTRITPHHLASLRLPLAQCSCHGSQWKFLRVTWQIQHRKENLSIQKRAQHWSILLSFSFALFLFCGKCNPHLTSGDHCLQIHPVFLKWWRIVKIGPRIVKFGLPRTGWAA